MGRDNQDRSHFATDYDYLAQGRSLGKKVLGLLAFTVDGSGNVTITSAPKVNMFEVRGPDKAAMNLQVTLAPPRIIPIDGTIITAQRAFDLVNSQNASGSIDFAENEDGGQGVVATPMIATVQWGIGGVNVQRAEVDFLNGLSINLSASYLRLGLEIDPLLQKLNVLPGTSAIYEVEAFVGPGYAKRNNAQRTINFEGVQPPGGGSLGTSPVVPIPKFATRCRLTLGCAASVDPDTLSGWTAQVVFFRGYNQGYTANPNPAAWVDVTGINKIVDGQLGDIEIPNGSYYVAVRHKNSFTIVPRLIFDLGI